MDILDIVLIGAAIWVLRDANISWQVVSGVALMAAGLSGLRR